MKLTILTRFQARGRAALGASTPRAPARRGRRRVLFWPAALAPGPGLGPTHLGRGTGHRSRTCVPEPVEAAARGPGGLAVGGGRVRAAGVAGGGRGVHPWLTHVEETHVQLQVAAAAGLGHVGAEQGLWGTGRVWGTADALEATGLRSLEGLLRAWPGAWLRGRQHERAGSQVLCLNRERPGAGPRAWCHSHRRPRGTGRTFPPGPACDHHPRPFPARGRGLWKTALA